MSSTGYTIAGIDLIFYLQPFFTGGQTPTTINYKVNGTSIATQFARRDNNPNNAPSITTGYKVNGVDISTLFNKINPSLTITPGGSVTYNGQPQQATITLNSPTDSWITVTSSTKTNAGTYAQGTLTYTYPTSYVLTVNAGNFIINPRTITLTANGSSSFSYTGSSITFSNYTISGNVAADSGYSVGGTTKTNCGSYTATLSATSSNYVVSPTSYQLSWYVTPTTPANFTASVANYVTMSLSWSAVGGCTYNIYYWDGLAYSFLTNTSSTSYSLGNGATQTTYYYYVEATASSGTSVRTAIAAITTGSDGYYYNVPYDSGWADQRPLCLTGSKDGTIGLKAFVQGTYGITISQVGVQSAQCNFSTSLLWGTATRTIRWNLNGTAVNFPRSTDTSAPNPWNSTTTGLAPYYRATTTTGTITYTLVASGTGWSTNNTGGVSGVNWAYANWKNTGTALAYANPVNPSITYYP
jgi:hypothetical protein